MATNANTTVAPGANTPGYTYANGVLTSVGGKPVGTQAPAASSTFTTPSGAVVDQSGAMVSGPTNTGAASGATSSSTSDFLSQLQSSLLKQSGVVSSSNTNLENQITSAISGQNQAAKDSAQSLDLQYGQKEQAAQEQGQNTLASAQEAQRGFATNTTLLKQIQETTNKNVQQLEEQKQSLILQGNAAAASKISDIQMQAIQFQQQAQQQTFSNLLGMASFGLQAQQQQTQASQFQQQQSFAEQQAVSSIATKYGISVGPGETLASITTKAMPYASAEEKANLAQIQSQITANNAQTSKALADISANKPLGSAELSALAAAWNSGGAQVIAGVVKNTDQLGQILGAAAPMLVDSQKKTIDMNKTSGTSKSDAVSNILGNKSLSVDQQKTLVDYVNNTYGPDSAPSGTFSSLPHAIATGYNSYSDIVNSALGWITGIK